MPALFTITALVTIAAAIGAVTLRNLVHCALCLVAAFCGVGAAFVLLQAPFLAAVQLLIYVGAIAVLILFAIMLTRHVTGDETVRDLRIGWLLALLLAAVPFGIVVAGLARQPALHLPPPAGAEAGAEEIGRALMTAHLLPFELVSVLLTAALIGALVIAMDARHRARARAAAAPASTGTEPPAQS